MAKNQNKQIDPEMTVNQNEQIDPEMTVIERFIKISDELDKTESHADELRETKELLGKEVESIFERRGVQNIRTRSGRTVYISRSIYPAFVGEDDSSKAASKQALIESLRRRPTLCHMVKRTINHNTLAAWIREHIPEGGTDPVLPKWAAKHVGWVDKIKAAVRRSA